MFRTEAQIRAAHKRVSSIAKRVPKRVRELSYAAPCSVTTYGANHPDAPRVDAVGYVHPGTKQLHYIAEPKEDRRLALMVAEGL